MNIYSAYFKQLIPHLVFFALVLIKLSYFNLPEIYPKAYDWYGWSLRDLIAALTSSLSLLLIITAPLIFFRIKTRLVLLLLSDIIITLIIVSDIINFRFFGDIISIASLGYAWQVSLISDSILSLFKTSDLLFFADIFIALFFLPLYFKKIGNKNEEPGKKKISFSILFLSGFLLMIVPVREVIKDWEGIFTYEFQRFFGVKKIGLLNYHVYQAGRIFYNENFIKGSISEEDKEWALDLVNQRRAENFPSPTFGIAERKNLIIIMVESLMSFPIGLKIDNQDVTPNISAFIKKSVYFENFFDQTWEGRTSDGEFTSLQSLYPLYTGAVCTAYPENNYRGLPAILGEHGYTTVSATAYNGELWNNRSIDQKMGFQRSFFDNDYKLTEFLQMGLSDREFFRQTIPKLLSQQEPFMAYLITLSTHHPYSDFKNDSSLNLGDFKRTLLGNYINAVHYFDSAFGEFIEALKLYGLLNKSVVVLYGDHKGEIGESLELKRLLQKYDPEYEQTWKDYYYWINFNKLPFLIHLPNDELAGIRDITCGHLDIANTIFDILGIKDAHMVSFGRNLMLNKDSFVLFNNGSFLNDDTLFITADGQTSTAKVYNLKNGSQLNPNSFKDKVERLWEELEASNLIMRGDLIPGK